MWGGPGPVLAHLLVFQKPEIQNLSAIFIFIFKIIYLFIFGCVGSLLLRAGFL